MHGAERRELGPPPSSGVKLEQRCQNTLSDLTRLFALWSRFTLGEALDLLPVTFFASFSARLVPASCTAA